MPAAEQTPVDAASCAAAAALLGASRTLGLWSVAASAVAWVALALAHASLGAAATTLFASVAVAGLIERYFAARLALDAALFAAMAAGTIASLPALDATLARLGLLRRRDGPVRPLGDRIDGAVALARKHAAVTAVQTLLAALALAAQAWKPA